MQYIKVCSCDRSYFTNVQGYEKRTLFERWDAIYNAISNNIPDQYKDFLTKPEFEGDTIYWYAKLSSKDDLIRYTVLDDTSKLEYDRILADTLAVYQNAIDELKRQNKLEESVCLEKAILVVNKDFLFCYDQKVILSIWGMELKDYSIDPMGVAMKVIRQPISKPIPIKKRVVFDAGAQGQLQGAPEYDLNKGDIIQADNIPTVIPIEGYRWLGWGKNPLNHQVDEDVVFHAQYEPIETVPPIPDEPIHQVKFTSGDEGDLDGISNLSKKRGENIAFHEIPQVKPKEGYRFVGWDKVPDNHQVDNDIEFKARYEREAVVPPPIPKLPWYKRLWAWFNEAGCLRWILWLLLILLLLWLLWWLFHWYTTPRPVPGIEDRRREIIDSDTLASNNGGIYDPGNPYPPIETPDPYRELLPPNQGVMQPIDTNQIRREPGRPVVVANRLNILMENEERSIMDLAKSFKEKYPDEKYKVVYYDDVVKRMQIEFPPEEREQLKSAIPTQFSPEFKLFVFDESLFEATYVPNDPAMSNASQSWYLKAIRAPQAWDISKAYAENAKKVTVAIVDNGFNLNHPELKSKVVMPYNVWKHSKDVYAHSVDHGTHVAGTALAIANNGIGISGIAPDCAFMPIQVADNQDRITTTSVLDGILYALYQGADVVNVSLGLMLPNNLSVDEQRELQQHYFQEEERLWNEVMRIANKHKTIVVFAAGNDNMLAGIEPMNRPKNFIVVSAVDKNNNSLVKAAFSNHGEFSTISAPGVGIYSAFGSNGYKTLEGTSMAAPIITGSVALMKSINKNLTASQVKCVLQSTGLPIDPKIGSLVQLDKALLKVKNNELSDCASRPDVPSTGDVQVLLSWDNYNDLDLVCEDPRGESVWFSNKFVSSGGQLEIDMNVDYPDSDKPIENIFWKPGTAPKGKYRVLLIYYRRHIPTDETTYKVMVKYGGKTKELTGTIKEQDRVKEIFGFTL